MEEQSMSVTSNDDADSRLLPADAPQPQHAAGEVRGYLLFWRPGVFASEPPPGTTDPYGPPMPGGDDDGNPRDIGRVRI
jgi:hypothetical protein